MSRAKTSCFVMDVTTGSTWASGVSLGGKALRSPALLAAAHPYTPDVPIDYLFYEMMLNYVPPHSSNLTSLQAPKLNLAFHSKLKKKRKKKKKAELLSIHLKAGMQSLSQEVFGGCGLHPAHSRKRSSMRMMKYKDGQKRRCRTHFSRS